MSINIRAFSRNVRRSTSVRLGLSLVVFSTLLCSPAFALDKETLGEECYQILHEEIESSEEARNLCLEKLDAKPTETIVITPSRRAQDVREAPASVSVVTQQDIERRAAESVADMLRDVPGIEVTDSGQAGLKRIRLRGEESRRTSILIDGQPFADEREVGTPLLIAPEMIERIEVVRGTGSVLHGSRAIGGVVNIITKKGGYHPLQGSFSTLFDSASDGYRHYGSVYGTQQDWDYRASGSIEDHGDRESADGQVENTSYHDNSMSFFLGRRFSEHYLSASFDQYESSSNVYVEPEVRFHPPFLDFQIDAPQRDRQKAAVFYEWEPKESLIERVSADAYYQNSERKFNTFSDLELDFGAGPILNDSDVFNDSELDTYGASLQADVRIDEARLLVSGIDVAVDDLEQTRRRELTTDGVVVPPETVNDEADQERYELFSQYEWDLSDAWTLIGGVRGFLVDSELSESSREGLEPNSNDDVHGVGAASLRYRGFENTVLWGGWSQGYVYPTLINLATGAFAGPDFVSPNPDLDPETSNSVEAGARFEEELFRLEVSGFYTEGRDYIDHVRCSDMSARCIEPSVGRRDRVYVNIDEARSFGGELAGVLTFHDVISPYANVSWIRRRLKNEAFKTYDSGIPTLSGRIGLEAEHRFSPHVATWLDFYLRTAGEADERDSDGDVEEHPGWGTLNLTLGTAVGQKRQLKFVVDLLNLGDKSYSSATENIPARGRSAVFKLVADL